LRGVNSTKRCPFSVIVDGYKTLGLYDIQMRSQYAFACLLQERGFDREARKELHAISLLWLEGRAKSVAISIILIAFQKFLCEIGILE
jgi:hypothetical protein